MFFFCFFFLDGEECYVFTVVSGFSACVVASLVHVITIFPDSCMYCRFFVNNNNPGHLRYDTYIDATFLTLLTITVVAFSSGVL